MKLPKAKTMNIGLVFAYALAGLVMPLILPGQTESYALCAAANIPLIIAWMGFIWAGNRVKMQYNNRINGYRENNPPRVMTSIDKPLTLKPDAPSTPDKIKVRSKDLCNGLVILFTLVALVIAIILPDNASYYATAMLATDPFIIAWMGFIWGGKRDKMFIDHNTVNTTLDKARGYVNPEQGEIP